MSIRLSSFLNFSITQNLYLVTQNYNMKIINVVGARPNFMKVAPLHRAFQAYKNIDSKIVHTGQHYDERMSSIFFQQLGMPEPDHYLGVGSGSHATVTAKVMVEFEKIILSEKPDVVLVVGDVNSTLACALVTKKLNIPLIHVEAGLRSGDRMMPEEINRILTDSIADYLFVTEQSGMVHLAREGVPASRVHFVGNVMIDSLVHYRAQAAKLDLLEKLDLTAKKYVLITMHRPSNVDKETEITKVFEVIRQVSEMRKVVFPVHPRTQKYLEQFGLLEKLEQLENVILLEPQGYLEFILLMENAEVIITDSGGIQEESTFLKVPCLTIRDTTERPVTITLGSNILIPELDVETILQNFQQCIHGTNNRVFENPPFWDGKAAERIAVIINQTFTTTSANEISKKISLNA